MEFHSPAEVRARYETLPQEIKNLLYSPEMSFVVQQVGQKNRLHVDQIDTLNTETGQVMLGFIETKDFAADLMEMLNVDHVQADAIVQDVNEMLFLKIRESMKSVQAGGGASAASAVPMSPPAAPPQSASSPIAAAPPIQNTPETHPADLILTQKTISVPSAPQAAPPAAPNAPINPSSGAPAAPKPPPYKTDPYREPAE